MENNQNLEALERDLEADLLDTVELLKLGRDEAIEELKSHRKSLGALTGQAIKDIKSRSSEVDDNLKEVQRRLGELNLMLAEESLDDVATLEKYRERIVKAIQTARESIIRLDAEGRAKWSGRGEELEVAWHQFHRRLDLVDLHLSREEARASEEFAAERERLSQRIEELRKKPSLTKKDLEAAVEDAPGTMASALKIWFMVPEESCPEQDQTGKKP